MEEIIPTTHTTEPQITSRKKVVIGGLVVTIAILALVLGTAHKKIRTPLQELQVLEGVSDPTAQTVEDRYKRISGSSDATAVRTPGDPLEELNALNN